MSIENEIPRLPSLFRGKLSKAMPSKSIKKHPTKTYLSTIKAIYIIERLNDVFGILGWDFEHEIVGQYVNTTFNNDGTIKKECPYVVVKGRIVVKEFNLKSPFQYGGHEIDDKGTDPADGFKSAVTDAIGKCASFLEIGIQVFKGEPTDTTVNKSKRLDPEEIKPTNGVAESAVEIGREVHKAVLEEPEQQEESAEDNERELLSKRHKELFGRVPNKSIKIETLRSKVQKEEDKIAEEETLETPLESAAESLKPMGFEPINEPINIASKGEKGDSFEDVDPDDEPFDDEPEITGIPNGNSLSDTDDDDVKFRDLAGAKEFVKKYNDPEKLREEAKTIVFDLQMENASVEDIKEIKTFINETYVSLSSN
tara:strand:+ start:3719 stop:4822 length:1104 start_codon:yes stop_codon:yes gene_type:complete